jgi:hypothetical protein
VDACESETDMLAAHAMAKQKPCPGRLLLVRNKKRY